MDILDLERLVRRGAASLAEGLHFYWPSSNEDNKIHEMNITLHMGRALLESGFFAFPEASPPVGDVRLDLLGLHHPSKVALLCEFKCLDSPARAQEMIENVGRIKSFVLHTNPDLIHERLDTNSFQKFGLFAAMTWDVGYANWFASASNNAPHRTLSPLWAATSHAALNNDLLWGSCPLSYSHDPTTNQASQHWLVYLLFPLPLFLPNPRRLTNIPFTKTASRLCLAGAC
jgi:hypothetical protein